MSHQELEKIAWTCSQRALFQREGSAWWFRWNFRAFWLKISGNTDYDHTSKKYLMGRHGNFKLILCHFFNLKACNFFRQIYRNMHSQQFLFISDHSKAFSLPLNYTQSLLHNSTAENAFCGLTDQGCQERKKIKTKIIYLNACNNAINCICIDSFKLIKCQIVFFSKLLLVF